MQIDRVAKWAELNKLAKEKTDEVDLIKERMAELEFAILEEMAIEGVSSVRLDQGGVIYLHRDIYPKMEVDDPMQVLAAVKKSYPDIVREGYSPQTFRAILRELDKSGEELPLPLQGVVSITEKFSLRNRKR